MLAILGMRNEFGNCGLTAGAVDLHLHFIAGIRESGKYFCVKDLPKSAAAPRIACKSQEMTLPASSQ